MNPFSGLSIAAAAFVFTSAAAPAQEAPASLRAGLAGEWIGALGYRDYQSNELFELPLRTWVENIPDGVTQVRRSLYDEGADQPPVWIVSLLQSATDGTLTTAIMRAGRDPEMLRELLQITSYAAPDRWVVVSTRTGIDDDKPADIRVTETRNRDELMSVKEVRPAGDASAPWQFRNQTRLRRMLEKERGEPRVRRL